MKSLDMLRGMHARMQLACGWDIKLRLDGSRWLGFCTFTCAPPGAMCGHVMAYEHIHCHCSFLCSFLCCLCHTAHP